MSKQRTNQHTPTPYVVTYDGPSNPIIECQGGVIAYIRNARDGDSPKVNADFIVSACNSHDDLLAACRVCESAITELAEAAEATTTDWVNIRAARALARAAIAKATIDPDSPATISSTAGAIIESGDLEGGAS